MSASGRLPFKPLLYATIGDLVAADARRLTFLLVLIANMRQFLQRIFGWGSQSPAPVDSFAQLNAVAPLRNEVPATPENGSPEARSFVCREAILNRRERVAGYEFLLHPHLQKRASGKAMPLRRAYDDALIVNLGSVAVGRLLEHRLAFVGISPLSFDNPHLAALPPANTVLVLDPSGETPAAMAGLPEALQNIRERGFRIGCHLHPASDLEPLLLLCDFVLVSTPAFDGLQIADLVRRLRKLTTGNPLALLAIDIESSDDFQVCFRAGFDYFHGPFVTRREDWHPPRSNIDRPRIMFLLNQLRSGVESSELANSVRQDAIIAYKLLRYINAPVNGLAKEIATIEQCLLLLGRERFYRWLSLLLFDIQNSGYKERVFTEQALVRANLMERLGRRTSRSAAEIDMLFLIGLFSLLEELLARPLADILISVAVPPPVSAALLSGSGPLAAYLSLAVACENGVQKDIAIWAAACQLDAASVNADLLAALVWANEVIELDD